MSDIINFKSKAMKIEKSIEIKKDPKQVFEYLRMTKNQDNFSVWNMADPEMKKEYQGTDGNVGFIYSWDSTKKNVGAGQIEISDIKEDKSIDYSLKFYRPMQNTGKVKFELNGVGDRSTSVAWILESPSRFPMSLLTPIFKRMMGKDLEKGLSNLKGILESGK
jgi:hypothetical protein